MTSGVVRLALAEAPNEALPLNCRPNFGAAWLNKDKFKVDFPNLFLCHDMLLVELSLW